MSIHPTDANGLWVFLPDFYKYNQNLRLAKRRLGAFLLMGGKCQECGFEPKL